MARTAPVPNLPVIPGMNPGVFVMGGGGGNGRGGGGRGGNQGADGNGGGDGARGGGQGAGSCGPGSGGGCPNPSHGGSGTSTGDPVDFATGRVYTINACDLFLPGPLPLLICRSYSSDRCFSDEGLGYGWSHSLNWRVDALRRTLRIIDPHGEPTIAAIPEVGETVSLPCGALTRSEHGYILDAGDSMLRILACDPSSPRRYRLVRILDANGNRIEVIRDAQGHMTRIVDCVGREVRVRSTGLGRIDAFEVKDEREGRWVGFRTYEYDERGNLARAVDAHGHAMEFAYDEDHRLVRKRTAGGLVTRWRYDALSRCVETWCERDAGPDGLDGTAAPPVLADGTPAKGFLHHKLIYEDGFREVVTSRQRQRYEVGEVGPPTLATWGQGVHTKRLDPNGQLLGYTDSEGATWELKRDDEGRLRVAIDPTGGVQTWDYDERGAVTEMVDADGETTTYERDARGNLLTVTSADQLVVSYAYDDRGLMLSATLPDGGITHCVYDGHGNRVRVVEPDGVARAISYDFLGRPRSVTDDQGRATRFNYDAMGKLITVETPEGRREAWHYDRDGNLVALVDREGRTTTLERGGYHQVTRLVRPGGSEVRYWYDREQDLVRVVNEEKAEHHLVRAPTGRIRAEHTFDGRTIHYDYDHEGRIVRARNEDGTATQYEYDPFGRLVGRIYDDGTSDRLTYDSSGRLLELANAGSVLRFEYDRQGNLHRETCIVEEQATTVTRRHDARGHVVETQVAGGSVLRAVRNPNGRVSQLLVDDSLVANLEHDARGYECRRQLPQGGLVAQERDRDSELVSVRVSRPGPSRSSSATDVGPGDHPTFSVDFDRSPGGELTGMSGSLEARFRRDADGRIDHGAYGKGVEEAYVRTAHGDPVEAGAHVAARRYGPGGRLFESVEVKLNYDGQGRCTSRTTGKNTWQYAWGADGQLKQAVRDDGLTVDLVYDGFGRRRTKVVSLDGRFLRRIRYLWDFDALLEERHETAEADGSITTRCIDYALVPGSVIPLAQRHRGDDWRHLVVGEDGRPLASVSSDGAMRSAHRPALLGALHEADGALSLRHAGHHHDADLALDDNRHRLYDPLTGHYLSPEPLGLIGSLKPYAFVDGYRYDAVDIDGLARMHTRITRTDGGFETGTSGGAEGRRAGLHPAVQAALPPSNARGANANVGPENCAEPQALSNHLRGWEGRNAGRSCAPGQPGWRDNLRAAMGEIDPEGGIASRQGGGEPANDDSWGGMDPRASCPNCSQTIPRLYRLAGMNPPDRVIAPGARADGSGPFRTTPPCAGFNRRENAAASPIAGAGEQPHANRPGSFGRSEGADRWRGRR
ncbi:MAG: DUF6531 domain-containing protein [Myxococcota bacterium]